MLNIRYHFVVLGAAALLAACASGGNRGASAGVAAQPIPLDVTNENYLDVDIFVVRGNSRQRLGTVGGNASATLSIPANLIAHGELQLLADPIGSKDVYVTDRIAVGPDQMVELTIAPRMRMSSFAVYAR